MKYFTLAVALLFASCSDTECVALKLAPRAVKKPVFSQMESDSDSSSSDDDEDVALNTQVRIGSFKPDIADLAKKISDVEAIVDEQADPDWQTMSLGLLSKLGDPIH